MKEREVSAAQKIGLLPVLTREGSSKMDAESLVPKKWNIRIKQAKNPMKVKAQK